MSKHNDYTRFANQSKVEETPAVVEEPVDIIEEQFPVEEPEIVENEVNEAVRGIVEGCKMLNVREAPNAKASVISIIAAGNIVDIIEEESTEDFYAVNVEVGGVEFDGYCMKKFIRLV